MPKVIGKSKVTRSEIARMIVYDDFGLAPHNIGRRLQRSQQTVSKYLAWKEKHLADPAIKALVVRYTENEVDDLMELGRKARARLHELLDSGETKAIETTAIMDRTFQQRRLLESQSTHNISFAAIVKNDPIVMPHEMSPFLRDQSQEPETRLGGAKKDFEKK